MDAEQLSDLYEIQKLKARYFRCMDTKQWEGFRDCFTDDMQLIMDDARVPESTTPSFPSPDALVGFLRKLDGAITVHHGHMPEIDFVDRDHATGIWAMYDWVDDPEVLGGAWRGFGHYHEQYRRCDDGRWRIAHVHLTRLRVNAVEHQPSEVGPTVRL
jgi:SnoaL-like domain